MGLTAFLAVAQRHLICSRIGWLVAACARATLVLQAVCATLFFLCPTQADAAGWSPASSMANSRYAHTATVLPSGKVLVVGGLGSTVFATTTLYDPASNVWTAAASLNTARYSHSATLLPSGKVLVVGGYSGTAEIASA